MPEDLITVVQDNQLDPATYQYYKCLEKRTILFNMDIMDNIIETVYMPLKDFEDDDSVAPVTMYLHSSGGSVTDSLFLTSYLKSYKKKLNIYILGNCCSMAAVLVAACGKNPNITVYAYDTTYFLIHDGNIALGAQEARTAADLMAFNDKIDAKIRQIFIENTNITEEQYDSHARHQWFFFADEAKELGMINEIL